MPKKTSFVYLSIASIFAVLATVWFVSIVILYAQELLHPLNDHFGLQVLILLALAGISLLFLCTIIFALVGRKKTDSRFMRIWGSILPVYALCGTIALFVIVYFLPSWIR